MSGEDPAALREAWRAAITAHITGRIDSSGDHDDAESWRDVTAGCITCSFDDNDSPLDKDWKAACNLFEGISDRHGIDQARRMFSFLGAPNKKQRKLVNEANIAGAYHDWMVRQDGFSAGAAIASLQEFVRKLHWINREHQGEFGVNPRTATEEALRKYVLRALKNTKKLRAKWAAEHEEARPRPSDPWARDREK